MPVTWLLAMAPFASLPAARGASFAVGGMGGLMQQPGSSYYMAVQGAYAEVANASQSLMANVGYVLRPEFHSQGYADRDYLAYAMAGTKLTKATWHGLYAFAGVGEQGGRIKADAAHAPEGRPAESRYAMRGMAAGLEYAANVGPVTASLSHMTFLGYGNKDQFDAYVLWPVNFFFAKVGLRF